MTTETRKSRNYTEDFKRSALSPATKQGYKPSEATGLPGVSGISLIRHGIYENARKQLAESGSAAMSVSS